MSNPIRELVLDPLSAFYTKSRHLVNKCEKPDRAELTKLVLAVGAGFLLMGFIGFLVKLVHIPINNIIVGSG